VIRWNTGARGEEGLCYFLSRKIIEINAPTVKSKKSNQFQTEKTFCLLSYSFIIPFTRHLLKKTIAKKKNGKITSIFKALFQ